MYQRSILNMGMIVLTNENFDLEVLRSKAPVAVVWGAVGNVAANRIALQLEKELPPGIKLAMVDVDSNAALAMRFSIRELPYMHLFVEGLALESDSEVDKFLAEAKTWVA